VWSRRPVEKGGKARANFFCLFSCNPRLISRGRFVQSPGVLLHLAARPACKSIPHHSGAAQQRRDQPESAHPDAHSLAAAVLAGCSSSVRSRRTRGDSLLSLHLVVARSLARTLMARTARGGQPQPGERASESTQGGVRAYISSLCLCTASVAASTASVQSPYGNRAGTRTASAPIRPPPTRPSAAPALGIKVFEAWHAQQEGVSPSQASERASRRRGGREPARQARQLDHPQLDRKDEERPYHLHRQRQRQRARAPYGLCTLAVDAATDASAAPALGIKVFEAWHAQQARQLDHPQLDRKDEERPYHLHRQRQRQRARAASFRPVSVRALYARSGRRD
jgi:hypothetical protein